MRKGTVTNLIAVGDICVDRANPDSIFKLVSAEVKSADFAFCQIETTYSKRGAPNPEMRQPLRAAPNNVKAIAQAGFNIASFASNHCMDWGKEAFVDTLAHLNANGIRTIGAGNNLAEARKPLIVESNGNKIGWLAYCSVGLPKNWADEQRVGCAPARAHTVYEPLERDQPGTPARILSFPNEADLEAMCADIRQLKKLVDVVMVSMHWGIHHKEAEIAMYQRTYGHRAIDGGADVILGHHAHILKAAEVYRGKPIFYSLCNFAFDVIRPADEWSSPERLERQAALNPNWKPDARYKTYAFPEDSRKSLMVRIAVDKGKVKRVSCVPLMINEQSQARCVRHGEPEFAEILEYMNRITKSQKLSTQYKVSGDEFLLVH